MPFLTWKLGGCPELLRDAQQRIVVKEYPAPMSSTWKSLAVIGALVIGIYMYTAPLGRLESLISNPADTYYNLLVQGFRDGHLSLKKEVPTGFARLADPYDPDANWLYRGMPYGLSDLSYYKGRLYLYFGVTPTLLLFWPFVALTGHYLFDRTAVTIFCAIGITAAPGSVARRMAALFCRGECWGGGDVRAGACLCDRYTDAVATVRRLPSGRQLRVYAYDVGTGGRLVRVARHGKEVSMVAGSKCGVWTRRRRATVAVVWWQHPIGASSSRLERAATDLAGIAGCNPPNHFYLGWD